MLRVFWAGAVALASLTLSQGLASALPPAGSEMLPIAATASVTSRLGDETVFLTGWAQIERGAPYADGGDEVVDIEVTALDVRGASIIGAISVSERRNDGGSYVSSGQVRSSQPDGGFPASASFDLFVEVSVPASPFGSLLVNNETSFQLTPEGGEVDAWPPLGASFEMQPLFDVDNDGDTLVDEDTADDDGDGLVDEDRPGPDPVSAADKCGNDADCDGVEGEDPPVDLCPAASDGAETLCDQDADGAIDEDPSCVPLFNPAGAHFKAGLCVRGLTLEIAPELPSYSVARGGPSNIHPADVLALTPHEADEGLPLAPFVRIPCASLGLTADGCDDGADGAQDDVNALSYGSDFAPQAPAGVSFSVGPGAQGVPGSGVRVQRDCPPGAPGLSPEAEPDEFFSPLDGTNEHVLDGNGRIGACSPAFPLGFVEGATVRDDLDAVDGREPSAIDTDGDGVPDGAVYFSLDGGSPSLTVLGHSAGDILQTSGAASPAVYASRGALGLQAGDDIDTLCLRESGDGVYGAGDELAFSLAPGSPTLSGIGAGPGALLAPGGPPVVINAPPSLGLQASDDVDAAKCRALGGAAGEPDGDVNCDGMTDAIDAALLLQHDAGLLGSLSCPDDADVSQDGSADSVDAALVLQFVAGLIDRLPYP